MNRRNYQKELERMIDAWQQEQVVPKLLLHACCAPCSSYVLAYLAQYMRITVFFYNPNITKEEEYRKRLAEEKRLLASMPLPRTVDFLEAPYDPERFLAEVHGLEQEPEGGARCEKCFQMRLSETARAASEHGYDCFTTSLTISPLKNAALLNAVGEACGLEYGVPFLPSDFKKKDGYKQSITLSAEYDLYRQDYCGCVFSQRKRMEKKMSHTE